MYENRDSLVECMEEIENSSWQGLTITQTRGLRLKLEHPTFQFWLTLFYQIMPHVDILYNQLQRRCTDPITVKNAIANFEKAVQKVRDISIDKINIEFPHSVKRKRHENSIPRSVAAKEVCDTIICHAKDRFAFTGHLTASNLFVSDYFAKYEKQFPHALLQQSCETYPFLDKDKLKTELEVLYMREDFRNVTGAVPLLQFIIENNLQVTLSECFKLLKIVVTIPMTTSEAERCFSTMKRVKTFLRSTMSQERLTALAMLSIEKDFVSSVVGFNESVIDKFATLKDRRMDFSYKLSA